MNFTTNTTMISANSTLNGYHQAPVSETPLSELVRQGLVVMGVNGLASTISTFSLLAFMTHRMIYWQRYYEEPLAKNQVLLLMFNLIIADFQQSLAFVISFYWLHRNEIVSSHPMCQAQGWFLQIGDVSSGFWVFAIACHTFLNVVLRKSISMSTFTGLAIGIWVSAIILSVSGPLRLPHIFVANRTWCWMDPQYQWERLYLHYAYIFLAEVGSIIVYAFVIFYLWGQVRLHSKNHAASHASSGSESAAVTPTESKHNPFAKSQARILKTARYMMLYPAAYVMLTLPFAAALFASLAYESPPTYVFVLAGTMISSTGWIDVLLYLTTRKVLISTKRNLSRPSFWRKLHDRARHFCGREVGRVQ